jgi:hypothetical protein
MDVTPAGMVIPVRALAPENALTPIDVRLLPTAKVTDARLLVLLKALSPMEVTPAGMVIPVRALAPENAISPIDVTSAGMAALPVQSL